MLLEALWFYRCAFSRKNRSDTVHQLYIVGIKSLGVITVVAFFTGMILALQTGLALADYGQQVFIGSAVAVSVIREMGPFMCGLIVAASVGSSMAAQIGTMTVSEEIDALEIMGININRFIVMPRIVALTIMMPFLTLYTDIVAILGGALVGLTQLNVEILAYMHNAMEHATMKDLYVGLLKAYVFGLVIGTLAAHEGFSAKGGAVGVGISTRRTVVISFLLILILGYMLTRIFYL
jgi:phospholipid/cholesterol/gamma-HCH transport system permease protein